MYVDNDSRTVIAIDSVNLIVQEERSKRTIIYCGRSRQQRGGNLVVPENANFTTTSYKV
jgi:hypothetical protein